MCIRDRFVGYVNVIQQRAKRWNESGGVDKFDVPEYSKENLGICREALVEAVAETSEEFMDRYFGGEEFSDDEIRAALRANVLEGSIVPVLMGSNILARGMYTLMADIVKYLPSPEKRSCTGINTKTNEVYNADYDFAKSKSAYVFKSIVDPYIGKYSLIKVNSGVLKTDDVLYNYHRDCDEKIGKLYVMRGSKVEEVKELHAGDIGALAKLAKTLTTDSLSTRNMPVTYLRTSISKPYVAMRYKAKKKGDEDKISQSLQKLLMEDLTLNSVNDSENGQTVLYGIGDMQLEVVASELLEKYKVEIELMRPKVAFKAVSYTHLFELGNIFIAKELPLTEYPDERETLCAGVFGEDESFFTIKGLAETVADALDVKFTYKPAQKPFLHPYQTAEVFCDGQKVGYLGQVRYEICDELDMRVPAYVMELDLRVLSQWYGKDRVFTPISKFDDEKRDFAFVVDKDITCEQIENGIREACDYVSDVTLFDVYEGVQLPPNKKSMAYSVVFTPKDEELKTKKVEGFVKDILAHLKETAGITLRG